jgi:autotransporter-associated beta strand protein
VSKTGLANGGFGNLNSTPAPIDTDQDGIPDFYELAVTRTGDVWNSTVDDHNTVCVNASGVVSEPTHFPANTPVGSATADKYTHLEEYLHFLSVPHAVMPKSTVAVPSFIDVDLRKFTRGFVKSPVFTVSNVLNGTAVLQPNGYTVRFTAQTGNFTNLTVPYGRAKFDFTVTDADNSTWTQRFDILVASVALPRDLTWKGAGNWDAASQNWTFKTSATSYSDPDNVTFDDTGTSTSIPITSSVAPSAVNINATQNYAFSGAAITGSTALRKFGTGTLTLANANAYTGGTVIDGSTLILNPGGSLGTGALTLQNGATLTNNSGGTSIAGLVVPAGSSATFNSGTGMTLATGSAVTGGGSLLFNVQNGVTFKAGAGAFAGPINFIGAGTVTLYSNGGSFGGFDKTMLDIGGSVTLSPRTNSGGNTYAIASLSGSSATAVLGGGSAGPPTYNIGGLNLSTTFAGAIAGNAIVNKVGTGTLTLTGTSTYTGATGLNAGSLVVNGSLGATAVAVASGTTLSGSGTIGGTVSVAGSGRLAAGNPGVPGTLTVNALTLSSGAILPFDLSSNPASGNDKIVLNGGVLTLANTQALQFNLVNGLLGAGTYPLISGGSNTTASNSVLTSNLPVGSRQTFTVSRSQSGSGQGFVNLVVNGTAATLTWLGSPTNVWDTNSSVSWTGAPEATPNNKFLSFDAVAFNDTDSNGNIPPGNLTIKGIVSPRSLTVTNSALNYTFTGGSIAGGGALIKNGSGTLTLASTVLVLGSTTTVGTTVNNVDTTNLLVGMAVTGSGIPDGTTIASITNSTTLVLSQAATAAATVNLNYFFYNTYSGGTVINGGTIVLADETANYYALGTGPITFNGGTLTMYDNFNTYTAVGYNYVVPTGAVGYLNTDSRSDLNGSLTGGGTLNYRVTATRTSLYGDWSAFTGIVNVSGDADGGDFRYGTSYGYPGFPQAAITLGDKVWMYYIGTLSGGEGTTIPIGELSGPATANVLGGATTGRALTLRVGSRNTDATFAGKISEQTATPPAINTTSYVKTGTGTWTLSGTCTYNGGTTVEQGTLRILGTLTSPQAFEVLSGANLSVQGGTISADAINIAAGATLTGSGTLNSDLNNDGNVTCSSGTITVTGDVVNSGTMRFTGGSGIVATGNFVNNGVLDLLTGAQGLPANLDSSSSGVIIDSSQVKVASASKVGNTFTVQIKGYTGHNYKLQRRASLTSGSWTDIGSSQAGDSNAAQMLTFTDNGASGNQYFYRVSVNP